MFTLLSSAISNTLEVLAPPVPLHEEFVWRWDAVNHYYSDDHKHVLNGLIESTNICVHLREMARILRLEESEKSCEFESEGSIGASLEYLLQHNVLDSLSDLAVSDAPIGMCAEVLAFFTTLLSQSSFQLLPHKCVYNSLQKLILVCGKVIAGPYEKSEAEFLLCICNQINANPHLINCFLKDSFPLISALLALLQSPDQSISTKTGDALIGLMSALNDNASLIIATQTPFCSKILYQMVTLYHAIPRSLNPDEIESAINCCFGSQSLSHKTNESFSPAIRRFLCFLRWFVFFDMIISHLPKDSNLIKQLLMQFNDEFLEPCIVADITGFGYKEEADAEEHIFLTTVLLANCLRNVVSEQLSSTIGEFLLISVENESKYINSFNKHRLKTILLDRCLLIDPKSPESSHLNEQKRFQLCMATMQLFEEILNKPSFELLNNLVLNDLVNRCYYDKTTTDSDVYFEINEFDDTHNQFKPFLTESADEVSPGSSPVVHYLPESHIHRVVQYFTSLVPDELKSCQTTEELGYETYVREAQKHYQDCAAVCSAWNWSNDPFNADFYSDMRQISEDEKDEICSSNSQPEADTSDKRFYEGSFLAMLFDNLEYMVHLPYEVNLQVTSLISKLALFPNSNLNEYLLDPSIPLTRGARTLFSVLHKLVDELQISVQGVNNLKEKLQTTRKSLLGETEKDGHINTTEINTNRIVEALIVIEEFCKELAAIAFVKYHNRI